ncbi:MAG: DUF4395 domain-containing protein [Bacteroidales bacterium]|nr:DUF4395 domain-containing protein [Bacteroidales bacterium]MCF8402954.1 DUF4395 domain-containing protein [Bacteroidales bacterium]
MKKIINFGEEVTGYDIPVLNEREIRAAAGILFLFMFIAILTVIFNQDFLLLKYAVVIFLSDILIRVFVNPKYAPTLIIGRLIVRNQTPEYVGARQKKFAWKIGIILAGTMFILINIMNTYSAITGLICFVCLIFLFFESAFGICLGCKFYPLFFKQKAQYCPGEICDVKSRQEIQKTHWTQVLIVFGFFAFIFITIVLFNDFFLQQPTDLFNPGQTLPTN